jgi:ligand-binding sensor domain-containing protein/serine phosphatase RsbU (regulator of sigma subunit)
LPTSLLAKRSSFRFTHFSLEQGLAQVSALSILQDQRGFLWIGTLDGLNRYDGYTFTVYKLDRQDPHSLSSNVIPVLYEDRQGTLWAGTQQGGLNKFDRELDRWIRYQHDPQDPQSLSHDDVFAIHEDRRDNLWVGTAQGLNKFDRDTGACVRYLSDPDNPRSISHDHVRAIAEDRHGTLWIGTANGLNSFDYESGQFTRYHHNPDDADSLVNNAISSIYEDHEGTLWIGTNLGLERFDYDSGTFQHYQADADDPHSLSFNQITTLFEDRAGTLWIGTYGKGLNFYDREQDHFSSAQHDPEQSTSLSDNFVSAIYEDRAGMLWIGTNGGGLNMYDRDIHQFRHFAHDPHDANSLSHNQVRALFEDSTGLLWIGTYGGGLNAYDPDADEFFLLPLNPEDSSDAGQAVVLAIREDSVGGLWFGTASGVYMLDAATGEVESYRHREDDAQSLSHNYVTTIYEDQSETIWIGTGHGLNAFDRETRQFTRYVPKSGESSSLNSGYVLDILQDSAGILWIGTLEGGLNEFDQQTATFTHYVSDPADPTSLSHNLVASIHEDRAGTLWIGTGGGLNRFDRTTGTFRAYTQKDGLPNDVIYGILEDSGGNLWLSTNQGLSRFTPATETFRNYDARDGLQSNEFNGGAYHQGHDGEMFFGGINGFNAFYPDRIQDNQYPPDIVLTDFQVFNQSVQPQDDPKSLLTRAITETESLTLSYRDYVVSFEFAALHYASPMQNQYAYILEGFEQTWNYTDATRQFATYTNLPSGRYVFHVKASNSDGIWNEEGVRLSIFVTPPPWKTWWAYTLYGLALVVGVLGYVRYKQQKFERKQRELQEQRDLLEEQVKERTASLAQRNQELYLLHEVSEMFNSTIEWNQVLETVLREIQHLLHISATSFWLRIPSTDTLVCQHVTGPGKEDIVGWELEAGQGLTGQAVKTGKLVLVDDMQDAAGHDREIDDATGVIFHSLLSLPVKVKGEVIGVLNLLDETTGRFTEDVLRLVEPITASAASAIENARLYMLAQQQREAAESANKKILESIRYAEMIQRSLLPSSALIQDYLPHSFFLWKPRDIVGGDIYFVEFGADGFVIIVIDCTGHGVPGAFMSIIAASGIRRIVRDGGCFDPAEILQRLNTIVKTTLHQDTDEASSDDGLDAAICFVQPKTRQLTFSGAKLSLYCVHDDDVMTIKGDRQSIGYKRSDLSFEYTNHPLEIRAGMRFYLSTDGFLDQGGGPKGLSLGRRRFSDLLKAQREHTLSEQYDTLWQAFIEYKGERPRMDDVTVVGFEISGNDPKGDDYDR